MFEFIPLLLVSRVNFLNWNIYVYQDEKESRMFYAMDKAIATESMVYERTQRNWS